MSGTGARRYVLPVTTLGVVIAVLLAGAFLVERRRDAEALVALRDRAHAARGSAQVCQGDVAAREAAFQLFDARLDSLRVRVRGFETLEGPGVPADRYDEYLELFEAYNDSVRVWESRSQGLRAREARCRRLVEEHNAIVDTLKARLSDRSNR